MTFQKSLSDNSEFFSGTSASRGSLSRFKSNAALLLLLGTLLTHCGPAGNQPLYEKPGSETDPAIGTLNDFRRLMSGASVSCADGSDCPPGVGMLVAANARSLSRCTTFAVSESLLVTDRSCIPEELRAPGAACNGRVQAVFPGQAGSNAETVECASIVSVSSSQDPSLVTGPDYVFFKIKTPLRRKPLTLSSEPLEEMELQLVQFIATSPTEPLGVLRSSRCKTVQRTLVLPTYTQGFSPVATLTECGIQSTGAGAPLLDLQGQVRGWLQPPLSPTSSFPQGNGSAGIPENALIAPINLATNAACVSLPGSATPPLPTACQERYSRLDLQEAIALNLSRLEGLLQPLLQEKTQQWSQNQEDPSQAKSIQIFQWQTLSVDLPVLPSAAGEDLPLDLIQKQKRTAYYVVPRCFQPLEDWYAQFRWRLFRIQSLKIRVPLWASEIRLNRTLQHDLIFDQLREIEATVDFSPRDVKNRSYSQVKITFSKDAESILGNDTTWTQSLGVCKN